MTKKSHKDLAAGAKNILELYKAALRAEGKCPDCGLLALLATVNCEVLKNYSEETALEFFQEAMDIAQEAVTPQATEEEKRKMN